jgi:hypothetical protein
MAFQAVVMCSKPSAPARTHGAHDALAGRLDRRGAV